MKNLIKFITNTLIFLCIIIAAIFAYDYYQKSKGKVSFIFNYALLTMDDNSMSPEISKGDLLVLHKQEEYHEKDVVTFSNSKGELVTHRIASIDNDGYMTTIGDNQKTKDEDVIRNANIYGKVIYDVTVYSQILAFLYTYKWYIIGGFLVLSIVGKLLL